MIIHRDGKSLDGGRFLARDSKLQRYRHANHYALAAAAFLAWKNLRTSGGRGKLLFQSSKPQKSCGGCTSSMPTSQPSERWFPFHTTTPGMLSFVATLKTVRRCSIASSLG